MPLMPEDVVRKTFRSKLRGYDPVEVDNFMEEVIHELRRMQAEIDRLQTENARNPKHAVATSVVAEQEQLEQIRKERADLVREIALLQTQYDRQR